MLAVWLSLGALFGHGGLLDLLRHQREHDRLATENAGLRQEILGLELEIQSLKTDPLALERIAREELALGRPGEVVVFLGPPSDGPRNPPSIP